MREIGAYALYNCKSLKCVTFAEGSRLEIIKTGCFSESGIVELSIPNSVTIIEDYVFNCCEELMCVLFAEGS